MGFGEIVSIGRSRIPSMDSRVNGFGLLQLENLVPGMQIDVTKGRVRSTMDIMLRGFEQQPVENRSLSFVSTI